MVTLDGPQRGSAEQLLSLVLNSGAHLWHNRPGVDLDGRWYPDFSGRRLPTPRAEQQSRFRRFFASSPQPTPTTPSTRVPPGLHVPAAVTLYSRLLEIYALDSDLMAQFGSYAVTETEWRDLKVACAALLLVQPLAGQPVRDPDGSVAFHEDDLREVGEAMLLYYKRGSTRMINPKGVLRVAQLLEMPEIASLNRQAGFGDPASRRPPLGRWPKAAREWLAVRESNPALLDGLARAGYKGTIKQLSRKCGYKPETARFFEVLGWRQKQSSTGHRTVGMGSLNLVVQERFDDLTEEQICARIADEGLSYKETVGRLPAGVGLTPAVMVALLPSLSDRDLRQLTPTLEGLGLLKDSEINARWQQAIQSATDQRALSISRNVRNKELREQLEQASDRAAQKAVEEAVGEEDVMVIFLVDKSGSMESAIDDSKEALSRILAGFPPDRLHIAVFDTVGRVVKPKAPTRAGIDHALAKFSAAGGTDHSSAVHALSKARVRVPTGAKLIVIVAGDENGESPARFASALTECGYRPDAMGLILSVNPRFGRGGTVTGAAAELQVPFTEVRVDQFDDPYQVTRVLTTMLSAPVAENVAAHGWLERVLAAPRLTKPA